MDFADSHFSKLRDANDLEDVCDLHSISKKVQVCKDSRS